MSEESFEKNFKLLEQFTQDLHSDKVSIDNLVPRMKDALKSVKICKQVLQETQSQLEEISREFAETGTQEQEG